jgi:hypothetical protein
VSLRTHLAATITQPPAGPLEVVTACNRQGYKHPRGLRPEGEWQAVAQIGGMIALRARAWDRFMSGPLARDACARCRAAWEAGADGAD